MAKINLNLKEFDFKQFFLKYGEWVGLVVAAAIMLPAFAAGVMNAVTAGSAHANAEDVARLASTAERKIRESNPTPDAEKVPDESEMQVRNDRVKPEEHVPPEEWFIPSAMEDTKRRAPVVLSPADFQSTFVPGGMMAHIFTTQPGGIVKVMIIKVKQTPLSERQKRDKQRYEKWVEKMKKRLGSQLPSGMNNMMGGGGMMGPGGKGGGMGGMMGGGMGGMMGGRGMMGGPGGGEAGGMGMGGGPMAGGNRQTHKQPEYVDVDKVANEQDAHLAQTLIPLRMVIVTGTFPLKQQLQSFRSALRKRTLNDLMAVLDTADARFEFAGFEIDRRTYDLNGKLVKDWEERYDKKMYDTLKAHLARAIDTEKEDPKHREFWGIINRNLIWARPALELPFNPNEEASRYPPVEIASLKETIASLEKVGVENVPKVKTRLSHLAAGEIDPGNPDDPLGTQEEAKADNTPKPAEGDNKDKDKDKNANADDPTVPEKALVRFLDLTVEPGYTYEYRVKVKMHNPNYKKDKEVAYLALAKNPYIVGEPVVVPRVTVPWETQWYVTDERPDKERINVQIHKWLWDAPLDDKGDNKVAVADWTILEKGGAAAAFRGEYVGRSDLVQVPMWNVAEEEWQFASSSRRSITKRIPVDFQVKPGQQYQYATMLLDYEGGKKEFRLNGKSITDEVPVQALVLNFDGKLELRSGAHDREDAERKQRYEDWKKRLDEVKNPTKQKNQGNNLFNKGGGPSN